MSKKRKKRKKRYAGWKTDLVFDIAELLWHILCLPFRLMLKLLEHLFD